MPDQFTLLLEWRRNEGAGRGLAKLPPDYYAATTAYLVELRRSYESDLRENPSGRKGEISRQTYQRASQVARDILEGRVQKVVSLAFQASIGGGRELPNSLPEERALFDDLVRALLDHRRAQAPYLEAIPAPTPPTATPRAAAVPTPPSSAATSPPPSAARAGSSVPVAHVRILEAGHRVEVGADSLDLRVDDLVALPAATAKLLIDARVAESVTPTSGPLR